MAFCAPCNRSFNAYHSYLQHLNNSPQHRHDPNTLPYRPPAAGLHCVACGRVFYTRVEFVRVSEIDQTRYCRRSFPNGIRAHLSATFCGFCSMSMAVQDRSWITNVPVVDSLPENHH
ncbi:hypothetical protein PGTUg99_021899 [Puccinia graminis f. sp. tritici]|uniref:Uncharacterized protein n=1 Tax=Puccinia graminis f. sp. tritici TaxID=56615 RepID=A0A5B0P284_PUCGR|nr:hypothetical protein PGTUg99_021899 [Puccinia graminis f. sp. tritici]